MGKHAVFMVHGMGEQQGGWHEPAVKQLRKAWDEAELATKLGGSFDDFYDIYAHRYSDEFIEYWQRYKENSENLRAVKIDHAPGVIKSIFKASSAMPDTDNLLLTHWADVLIYATSGYNEKIAKELILKLREQNFDNYSIIAHSLGTRVVHDALQRGYTDKEGDYQLFGVPTVLLNVANVSRLMSMNTREFEGDGYNVFPSGIRNEGACWHLINTHHWADIIGSIRPFKMHSSSIPSSFSAKNYVEASLPFLDLYPDTRFNSIKDFLSDTHSLENHLAHPCVYVPFFNRTLRPASGDSPVITGTKYKQLLKRYQAKTATGELLQHLKNIRSELQEIELENNAERIRSIKAIIDNIKAAIDLIVEH